MSNDWPPPPPRAGTLLRRRLGDDLEIFFVYLFISGAVSIPIAVIGLFTVFKFGHATSFPPGDPHTGWVETPETRGTLNIISVCASTIFACVYVSVHVDIPNETKTGGKVWQYIAQPVLRKLYWLLFNIFAPELMVLVALCERWSAGSGVAFMRSRGAANWTMRLAFFADMGGFKLPAERGHKDGRVFNSGLEFYEWFVLLKDRPQDLNFKEIELDIRDRSKRNGVLKVFTCLQATWLLIETVVRFAQHQPVSELEVTTCSYIVCALVTYGCWLSKPYGVERRITLRLDGARIETEAGEKAEQILRESKLPIAPFPGAALFSRAYDDPDRAILICCHLACLAGALIGVMHAVPFWNALFVRTEIQWIWRACSLAQVSLCVGFAFIAAVQHWQHSIVLWIFLLCMALIYNISRMVLLALICLSLWSQPVGVYRDVHWALGVIPHWD